MKLFKEILENKREDEKRAKEFIQKRIKQYGNNYKKIHKHILDNVVNSAYGKESNNYIDILWDELKKEFPS